jgi:hypothetical protein
LKVFLSAYRLLNLLSLDVVAGSISSSLFFSHLFKVPVHAAAVFALGLSVWCIYTLDHLHDVAKLSSAAFTERHRFHQRHFTLLLRSVGTSVIILMGILPFLPKEILKAGAFMFTYLMLYFSLKHYAIWKEFLLSLGYTMGILVPCSTALYSMDSGQLTTIIAFATAALINVILFSWFDIEIDRLSKYPSIAQRLGKQKTCYLLGVLFFIQGILIAILLMKTFFTVSCILGLMNLALFIIFFRPLYFGRQDRFRLVGGFCFYSASTDSARLSSGLGPSIC